jgi:hypothetical protein
LPKRRRGTRAQACASNRSPDLFSLSQLKARLGAQAKSLCSDACVTFLEV